MWDGWLSEWLFDQKQWAGRNSWQTCARILVMVQWCKPLSCLVCDLEFISSGFEVWTAFSNFGIRWTAALMAARLDVRLKVALGSRI